MAKHLTPRLLREATAFLSVGWYDGAWSNDSTVRFMCWALDEAIEARYELIHPDNEARKEFEALLTEHGVSLNGYMYSRDDVDAGSMDARQRQALRFDFMNLLAHSLETRYRK